MWFNAIQFTKFFSQKPRTGSQKFKKQYFNLSLYSAHKLYVLMKYNCWKRSLGYTSSEIIAVSDDLHYARSVFMARQLQHRSRIGKWIPLSATGPTVWTCRAERIPRATTTDCTVPKPKDKLHADSLIEIPKYWNQLERDTGKASVALAWLMCG